MIQVRSHLTMADNSGVRKVWAIGVLGKGNKKKGGIGDVMTGHVREANADALAKKGEVVRIVIVRTRSPIRRRDGTTVRFDSNAAVLIDAQNNPRGTRVFGPIARELRERRFMKIISLAPEVV
jgi:large subunit ribosomal protein L14